MDVLASFGLTCLHFPFYMTYSHSTKGSAAEVTASQHACNSIALVQCDKCGKSSEVPGAKCKEASTSSFLYVLTQPCLSR